MSNIISIHFGHNATVAWAKNGKIKYCISEERFNRIKNSTGFPDLALAHILGQLDQDEQIDYFVITQRLPWGYEFVKKHGFKSRPFNNSYFGIDVKPPLIGRLFPRYYYNQELKNNLTSIEKAENDRISISEMSEYFRIKLNTTADKIIFLDHHQAHAFSTAYFLNDKSTKTLVFTLDGEGDGLCATVNIFNREGLHTISKINKAYSLGYLYREVTAFLGMKPDEHEFKVMGLAPYAKPEYAQKILPIFRQLLWLNDQDEFTSDTPTSLSKFILKDKLLYGRFDNISGAIQSFTEEITLDWIKRWIAKTGIRKIAIAGGVFMNVKMDQRIAELPEVDSLTIVPSAGDESTVFGGCYFGLQQFKQSVEIDHIKVDTLYLGNEYLEQDIAEFIKLNGIDQKYHTEKPENINAKAAQLLAQNQVVARFDGRMEFGARALGNRSILANPSSYENVRIINEMIKNRDFWMPFATSILEDDANRYIINPKNIDAPHMAITFDTTEAAQKDILAAIHPYDKTSRPQIVKRSDNPKYYDIISEFKKLTGIGAILNTSFNLHGEPNVESPKDAIHTFENSGLNHLILGPYLISKK